MDKTIGFIGAGAMGGALIEGLLASRVVPAERIVVFDISRERLEELARKHGIRPAAGGPQVVEQADIVVVAVKPETVAGVLRTLSFKPSHLVISVAAGITLKQLEGWIGPGVPIMRAMPNTPALVREGITVLAGNGLVTPEQGKAALEIFASVGQALLLPEDQLDAVTGLSGSGPAYVYLFIEALADGGVLCGLGRDTALKLAAQTVLGAARMVLNTGEHPAVLKSQVTSPGGTTIAGLEVLENRALRGALMEAVRAAARRARALSEGQGK
ncbi:MAG TPA: pyrroline-5-carboxylate reductase [Peptococcaceae bacterium]|nr:MAG: Pyrroline-5-carboxylate reductase [Moorella sp. 60_41]HBT48113.1 pyrroline-5-carboxylate reductase [Peptococcaceae bacterium]